MNLMWRLGFMMDLPISTQWAETYDAAEASNAKVTRWVFLLSAEDYAQNEHQLHGSLRLTVLPHHAWGGAGSF